MTYGNRRVNKTDVHIGMVRVERMMKKLGITQTLTLHMGNVENKISNKLVLDKMNLWPDHMAGCSTRECYNALRIMEAALSVAVEVNTP